MATSLRCRWSPGKRLPRLPGIPETMVTPRLAPPVSVLRWGRRRWVGWGAGGARWLQTDPGMCLSSSIAFLSESPQGGNRGRASSRCNYSSRDKRGRQGKTLSEAWLVWQSAAPPPPSQAGLVGRPGGGGPLKVDGWMAGNEWRFERHLDQTSSFTCQTLHNAQEDGRLSVVSSPPIPDGAAGALSRLPLPAVTPCIVSAAPAQI